MSESRSTSKTPEGILSRSMVLHRDAGDGGCPEVTKSHQPDARLGDPLEDRLSGYLGRPCVHRIVVSTLMCMLEPETVLLVQDIGTLCVQT